MPDVKVKKAVTASAPTRRLSVGRYKSFRLQRKKLKPVVEDRGVPAGMKLFRQSFRMLLRHWRVFGGILLLYAVIKLALAGGLVDVDNLIQQVTGSSNTKLLTGGSSPSGFQSGALVVLELISKTSVGDATASTTGAYQLLILVLTLLSITWALRRVYTGKPLRLKLAIYNSAAPLIPFLLVVMVLLLEMVPFVAGGELVVSLAGNNIAQTWLEQGLLLAVFFLLTVLSLYWVAGSLFALFIVTLPNTSPIEALQSSHELTRYRRGVVLWRILSFLLVISVITVLLVVPIIIAFPAAASGAFFVFFVLMLGVTQSYMFALYRALMG